MHSGQGLQEEIRDVVKRRGRDWIRTRMREREIESSYSIKIQMTYSFLIAHKSKPKSVKMVSAAFN